MFEDAICLVFLELVLRDFAVKSGQETLLTVLRQIGKKMSPRGRRTTPELAGILVQRRITKRRSHIGRNLMTFDLARMSYGRLIVLPSGATM